MPKHIDSTIELRLRRLERDSHKPVDFTVLIKTLVLRIEILEKEVSKLKSKT